MQLVEAQSTPDGNFPTVASPNPEESAALAMAVAQAEATNADLVIGCDPDTDRVGIAANDGTGKCSSSTEMTRCAASALHLRRL